MSEPIMYCQTHKEALPYPGWRNPGITVRDDNGRMVPKKDICPGYGRVEFIDEGGWAELDRDPCVIVEMVPRGQPS